MATDYYLYDHGLPNIASCHLSRISLTLIPELLNANIVRHVGTAKGSAVMPEAHLYFAQILQLGGAK
jgi:hypothetical protein